MNISPDASPEAIREYNRQTWDAQVAQGNRWTVPVSPADIANARKGKWAIVLTPTKEVPRSWFGELQGCELLCLAGGGGQQAPILAAAGANVTVLDNSAAQLAQDQHVAQRERLKIKSVQGDMANLCAFEDETFDLIVHPCSNTFVPDVKPVWKEAYRVLKTGGSLLSGLCNPIMFIFDDELREQGELKVVHSIPYSDVRDASPATLKKYASDQEPVCFGHTLDDQIGGQIDAGFALTGFYEDFWDDSVQDPLSRHIASFMATKATKFR